MAKRTPNDLERIMADTEDAMLRLRNPFRVYEYIGRRWNIEKRQVQRYMAKVQQRWQEAATYAPKPDVREHRRNMHRATLDMMLYEAINRTEVVKNDDGTVVLDEREYIADSAGNPVKNPNYKKPFTRPAPDRRAALYAARLLAQLDALNEPVKAQLEVTGFGDSLPDLDSIPQKARDHLVKALEDMAPDGDLRKLAGDLFAANARAAKLN